VEPRQGPALLEEKGGAPVTGAPRA